MRITQSVMTANTLRRLQERLSAFERSQSELGTGKRIQRPSDDVPGIGQSLRLRSALSARRQESRNADDGAMWVAIADSELRNGISQLQRARELVVRGSNHSDSSERDAISQEIVGIRDSLVSIANSQSQGRRIFGGFQEGKAVQQTGGSWVYTGDTGQVTRRVSESDIVTVNVTSDRVFGFASGRDVFSVLDDVVTALASGDQVAVSASLGEIDRAMENILDGLSFLGAAGNRIEAAQVRNQDEQLSARTYLSEVEDVDIAEAISELQMQETAYQAALGAIARAVQPSLIDFLR